jgi:hypothetical protein
MKMNITGEIVVLIAMAGFFVSCGSVENGASLSTTKVAADRRLAVLGDSIAAGFLADTTLGSSEDFLHVAGKQLESVSLASLKSILKGDFDAPTFIKLIESHGSAPEQSALLNAADWGLRQAVNLDAKRPAPLRSVVKWGDHLKDFDKSHKSLLKAYKKKKDASPAEVLALIYGGNDFCSGTSVESFSKTVEATLAAIAQSHPSSTVLISAVPNVAVLKDINFDYELKINAKHAKIFNIKSKIKILSCKQIQKSLCPDLDQSVERDLSIKYNEVLEQQIGVFAKTYGGKIMLVDEVAKIDLEPEDFAVDCFHPSEQGHRKIAESFINAYRSIAD